MAPDYPLLGLLARKPASGYDLGKWLRAEGQFLGRSRSMTPIYRALGEFQELGWVDGETHEADAGPSARVYHLTTAGRAALVAWADSEFSPADRPMAPDFMTRLNFAGQMGPAQALRIVRTELAFRRRQREAEGDPQLPSHDSDPIPEIDRDWLTYVDALTHDRGWQSTSLYIGWLETTERRLVQIVEATQNNSERKAG